MLRIVLLSLGGIALVAQDAPPPAFEVASIKPSGAVGGVRGGCHGIDSRYNSSQETAAPSLGRCVIRNARLSHLIARAWQLHDMNVVQSKADWIARGNERFDIEAKAEDPRTTTEDQLRRMLQTLLVDRFQLKFHRETVEKSGFALVIAKTGSKLRQSTGGGVEIRTAALESLGARPAVLDVRNYSMARLTGLLSVVGFGPVVDKTGLNGTYDFKLSWNDRTGPSLFTAIQEQLGLRLEHLRVSVSTFVVDSAQKPEEN
jgi:uncharacterized protein (TIGR03435 family)